MKITERERFRRCVLMEYAKLCYLGNVYGNDDERTIQIGRLSTFLELSDFTEDERDNEENKLRELCNCWEKRYYSKEEKINE
jgi:hypothetical protein